MIHSFTVTSRKQTSCFDLVTAAKDLYIENPEVRDTLFIVDVCNQKIVHPDKSLAAKVWKNSEEYLQPKCEGANERGSSSFAETPFLMRPDGDSRHSFVFIYNPPPPPTFSFNVPVQLMLLGSHMPPERAMRFVFNHEKAHALIKGGHDEDDKNRSERIADAYALLQDCKIYGPDEKLMRSLANSRIEGVALRGDKTHYTIPIIEGILAEYSEISFPTLNEDDIRKITVSLVKRYPLRQKHKQHIKNLITMHEDTYAPAQKEAKLKEQQSKKPALKLTPHKP